MELPDDTTTGPEPTPAPSGESSVADELRQLGERLAAALRAAATTSEAEALKQEVSDGMHHLRREIDTALESSPVGKLRAEGQPAGALRTVRADVAGALRVVNGALERLARTLEPATPPSASAVTAPSSSEPPAESDAPTDAG